MPTGLEKEKKRKRRAQPNPARAASSAVTSSAGRASAMAHGPGVRANRYMLLYRLYLVVADRHWIPFRICHVATVHRHSTCLLRLDPPVRVRASHRYTERAQSDTQARTTQTEHAHASPGDVGRRHRTLSLHAFKTELLLAQIIQQTTDKNKMVHSTRIDGCYTQTTRATRNRGRRPAIASSRSRSPSPGI